MTPSLLRSTAWMQPVQARKPAPPSLPVLAPAVQLARVQAGKGSGDDLLALQRSVGNQAVQRLVAESRGPATPPVQRALRVGPADDGFEQEAERVAGQVAQRSPESIGGTPVGAEGGALDGQTSREIQRARGGGKPLDANLRAPMEQALGADFSHARLHVSEQSDRLNAQLGARAFTHGADIFMKRSEFSPGSSAGRHLLYHEMTHVQQQTGGVQRAPRATIQRAVSKKEDWIMNMVKALVGEKHKVFTETESYLSGLNAKGGSKEEKKSRGQTAKTVKETLHLGGKHTSDEDAQNRVVARAISLIELAAGTPPDVVRQLQGFILHNYPSTINGDQLRDYLKANDPDEARKLAKMALDQGYSTHVADTFVSRFRGVGSDLWDKLEPVKDSLVGIREMLTAQISAGKSAPLRMVEYRRAAQDVNAAVAAHGNKKFITAQTLMDSGKQLLDVVVAQAGRDRAGGSPYNDQNLQGQPNRLGGGQVSQVYEVFYDHQDNGNGNDLKIRHGVFKPDEKSYDSGASPGAWHAGIDQYNTNTAGRSVASSKVDELFGFGISAKTEYGTLNGKFGTVQNWAPGKEPQKLEKNEKGGSEIIKYRQFDYDDPEIQRQLGTLQLFDAITGQVDRHPGNYYIQQDQNGTKLTAIDNDFAFGVANTDATGPAQDPIWKRPSGYDQYKGLPLFVDRVVAERVLATTDEQLKQVLVGHIRKEEIGVTLGRFKQVKQHLKRLGRNTTRIKALQKRVEIGNKYEGRFDKSHPELGDAMSTQAGHWRLELMKAYEKGALLDDSDWGERTGQLLVQDNKSYYNKLITAYRQAKAKGNIIN